MESDASKTATRTKSCLESIKRHNKNRARVIFLFGKACAGKSSLAEHITGVTGLRGSSETGTERCQIISTSINGTEYFIIDTPGFEDENSQWKIFCDIADILDQIRGHAVVSGVLFVAPVNNFTRRPDVFERRLYKWLAELCGESFSRHLTFVTTFWETHSANQLQKYNDQLQRRRDSEWASFIAHGARTYQFGKRYVRGVETEESLSWDTDTEELSAQAKERPVTAMRRPGCSHGFCNN